MRLGGRAVANLKLEDVFYSRVVIRIIRCLLRNDFDSGSNLVRISRTNYDTFKKHIKILMEYGIVKERRLGKIKVYMINKESPLYDKLRKIFSIWDS